jgi:hypothetical protein
MGLVSDVFIPGQDHAGAGVDIIEPAISLDDDERADGVVEHDKSGQAVVEDEEEEEEEELAIPDSIGGMQTGSNSRHTVGVTLSAIGCIAAVGLVLMRVRKQRTAGHQRVHKQRQEHIPLLTASFTASSGIGIGAAGAVAAAAPAQQL